jgi:penicillin amidase
MSRTTDHSPAYAAQVDGLGALRLDRLDPATESALVHGWVVQDRARFWMMQDHTEDDVRDVYTWIDEQPTHHAWLARLDGEPVSLFQDYQPSAEEVGEHYDVRPGDLGLHFMMAPTGNAVPGFTGHLMWFLLDFAFSDPEVQRIVVEPDVRNDKSVALLARLGMELGPVVQLSTKPAQLAFLTRERFAAARPAG